MQQIVIKTNPIKVKKPAGIDFNITVKKEKKVKVEIQPELPLETVYNDSHYEDYRQTNNKNLFEEVIEKMMIESCMDETFKPYIDEIKEIINKKLPNSKKRFAILCTLDKNRNLLRKAKVFNNNPISKAEHIVDYMKILRRYVAVSDVEKKKFGEVMTPIDLVKEMLQKLPNEVWTNPNLKWLDPCNGVGPFGAAVVAALMNGLKKWEPDEEKRYKHIIENMVYVCELQPKNMFLWMCMMDPKNEYDMNIYCGSFLDGGFDKHMKEVWGIDKFDIVIGNPPYQDGTKEGGQNKIYNDFSKKAILMSSICLFITPTSILKKNKRFSLIELEGLEIVDFNADNFFDVGVNICFWLLNKNYKGDVLVKRSSGNVSQSSMLPIYDTSDDDFVLIYTKLKQITNKPEYRMFMQNAVDTKTGRSKIAGVFDYPIYKIDKLGKTLIQYNKPVPKFLGKKKIIIPMTKSLTTDSIFVDTDDYDVAYLCTEITEDSQVMNIKSFLLSNYFTEHCKKWKELDGYGYNYALKHLPPFDKNKKWDDDSVKEFIEKTIQ